MSWRTHAAMAVVASLLASSTCSDSQQQQQRSMNTGSDKLPLNASHVIDGFCAPQGGGYDSDVPYNLLDEQKLAGDPLKGDGGTPQTNWNPGYTKWYYPEVFAVVDLGSPHTLSHICGYHQYGGADLEFEFAVEITKPSATFPVYTQKTPSHPNPTPYWEKSWACFNITATARFVSIRLNSPTNIYELVFYGSPAASYSNSQLLGQKPALADGAVHRRRRPPLMKSFLGVNGFVDDPVERLAAVAGAVREYQDWVWTEGQGDPGWPHALTKFEPSYSAFEIDTFYRSAANASLDVHQVIQNRPWFLSHGNKTQVEWKPIVNHQIHNLSAIVDPASYVAIAAHAYQVAARYGSVKVPSQAMLQLGAGQAPLSGLGILKHIEILNEPNGWWRGREGFMKPFEIAAMLSATYDAHEGRLLRSASTSAPSKVRGVDAGIGIKTIDPSMQVVMPGVTGTGHRNLDIVRMIRLWAQSERSDKQFPADVLNFHGYDIFSAAVSTQLTLSLHSVPQFVELVVSKTGHSLCIACAQVFDRQPSQSRRYRPGRREHECRTQRAGCMAR